MIVRRNFLPVELNTSAKVITALFVFYLGVMAFTGYFFGSLFAVTTPFPALAGSLVSLAGAFVGFNAARLFGGRRNFTGRLLSFYSVALLCGAISFLLWGVFARGQIPALGSRLEPVLGGTIVGHALAGFALFISAKALVLKVTRRQVALVVAALVFSLGFSLAISFYPASLTARIVWSGIWSTIIFIQLSSGLVLVSLLGRWYVARQISYIAFGYLGFSIVTPIVMIMRVAISSFSPADGWLVLFIVAAVTNYVVGLAMSQVRPMKRDIFAGKFVKQTTPGK